MVASESSDFDEDLLNLACEVEAAQKQEEKGESPREAKRRRLDVSSPFKKPFAPHTGPNDDGRGQTQVAHRPSPRPSMVQHGLRQAGRNADRVTEHGNQRAAKSATPFQRSNSMRQSQLTPWTLSQSQASTGPSSASNGTRESTGIPSAQKDDELDDPELAAAIKASLEDLEKQSPAKAAPASNREDNVTLSTPSKGNRDSNIETQDGFDTDEIPDDFFTSPFQATPKHAMRPPLQSASQSLRLSPQKNLRQMTLFGAAAPPAEPSQTSRSPSKSLSSSQRRLERPTHHKLEKDFLSTWVYPLNLGRKRDYQFNITKKALFHNLLVALPTGLGKTFIAATVMLNWFRWTTDAQIVFVAPTKPLVSQQVHACFNIAGIPRSATTLLTGESAPGVRAEEWKNKRVFFMTPQTFVNDLKHGIADPKRIVLLVVDEAHRATGNYAYVEAVKFLERFNQSFRVLALTATPGRLVETVQEIIDGLNIARVEIRTEQSLDIREYVHSRSIEKYSFENSMEMTVCMDLFARALKPVVEKLTSQNAYWSRDPMALTPFGLTQARARWLQTAGRGANQGLKAMMNAVFTVLAGLAHSIDLLKYHGIRAFYRSMLEFKNSLKGGGGGKYRKMIHDSPSFQTLMVKLKDMTSNPDFTGNPKMDYLQQVVLNHFLDSKQEAERKAPGSEPDTRIMIFAQYRDSAEDIANALKKHGPLIRPHVFVGQASAKNSEGMAQKQQIEVIKHFKSGVYNTIVATSIGEEGLDIGEVDLIVCYDSSASPVRLLQRMGRTGRKRRGNIVLLFMKGKEEDSHVKAMDNYLNMQKRIASGSEFTFHDDKSPRILPREYQPTVDEREIEIPVENLQGSDFLPEPKKRNTRTKRPPKLFHMPDGVETGFKMASTLNGSTTKRGAPKTKTPDSAKRKPRQIEIAEKPSISEVCLTAKQEIELNRSYRNVGGSTPQVVRRVRYDAFPSLQRSERRTDLVGHSNLTRRLIQSLRTMHCMPPDCDAAFRELLHPEDEELINQSWRSRERSQQRPASSEVDIGGITYDASSLIPAQTQSDYADSLQLSDTQPTVPDLGELSDRVKTPQAPERKGDEEGKAMIADSQDSLGLDLDLSD